MMNLELRTIDEGNWVECCCLSVAQEQEKYVYTNSFSLTEAHYTKNKYPLAIYKDSTMVGFIMYGYDEDIDMWALSRIMIDKSYQKQGIGTEAIKIVFDIVRQNIGNIKFGIRVDVDNEIGKRAYTKIGFKKEYDIDDEILMTIKL